MNVSSLISRLGTVTSLAQVIEASASGYQTPVDSAASLYAALNPLVSGGVHPLTLREGATHPSIVYQLVSSTPGVLNGFRISQTDRFVLYVRHPSFSLLVDLLGDINDALAASTYAAEIDDVLMDYDESLQVYRCNIEVSVSYLSAASQAMPAAFVYPVSRSASANRLDNYVAQAVENSYAIILATDNNDLADLMADVQEALLGWQPDDYHEAMEYADGTRLQGVAGMAMWRETYRIMEHIRQA